MKKELAKSLALFAMLAALSGCASTLVEGDGTLTPSSETGIHTAHGSFYDFKWSEPPIDKCDNQHGLMRVRAYTNPLYSLVSILSLGLYVPLTMEWWCDSTPAAYDDGATYDPSK